MNQSAVQHDPTTLSRAELEEHARALRAVLAIADAVHLSRDFDDLARRAVDAILAYTRYAAVALFRIDEAAKELRLVASRGFGAKTVESARRLPLSGSLTGLAVETREVVTTDHLPSDPRVDARVRRAAAAEGFNDVASVPIFCGDRALGAVNLLYKRVGSLGAHERQTLVAIGRTIGLAMANRVAAEEQRQLEVHMRRAEQLSSLGVLAGGIAHDFNNLLAGFLVNVSVASRLVRDLGEAAHPVLPWLDEAEKTVLRARGLVRQLLTFAQGGAPVKAPTDQIADIVRDAAEFATRGGSVRCEVNVAPDVGTVELDAGQLAQVVQNLVLNAVQASAEGAKVDIEVRLEDRCDAPPLAGERCLCVRVRDEGRGIPPDVLPRIFEPYFTTRREGTGLGLATTYSIVKRHGGHIDVQSALGRGTTFTARFPVGDVNAPAAREVPAAVSRGTGRILVVDDEPAIRRALSGILAQLGYEPEVVDEGQAALALYEQAMREGRPFRAVILDLTIAGGLGGRETIARLRAIDPNVRAIVCSGYSSDTVMSRYREHGFAAVLEKPYTEASLASTLRDVCEAPPSAAAGQE